MSRQRKYSERRRRNLQGEVQEIIGETPTVAVLSSSEACAMCGHPTITFDLKLRRPLHLEDCRARATALTESDRQKHGADSAAPPHA